MSSPSAPIPREILFGNPAKSDPRVSPDGERLAYLAPDEGVLNVWVRTLGRDDDRVVTRDRGAGVRAYFWAERGGAILFLQDRDGDENWRLYEARLDSREIRDLTPFEGVRVGAVITDRNHPDDVLIALNRRDPQVFDLYRLDARDGSLALEAENPGNYVGWLTDNEMRVRGATAATPDGGFELLVSKAPGGAYERFLAWGPDDNGAALGFTPDNDALYVEDNLDADTTGLHRVDLATGARETLARDPRVDLGPVLIDPVRRHVQAAGFALHKLEWRILDEEIRADMEALAAALDGEVAIVSRDRADRRWIVAESSDVAPTRYFVHDRADRRTTFLFGTRPEIEGLATAPMRPATVRSRDGLDLVCYLTTPANVEPRGLPLVLNVHGGPWARDEWGFDPEAQWLADRGYAVLQVNYRGSTGFGKRFLNAGNREWGARMHDDLIDAAEWAIGEGVADRDRLAIYGGSYGGYAALVGAAFTPEVFRCAVDIVGPSNICTLIESIPPYWAPLMHSFRVKVGDIETERGFLESRSPLFHADKIRVPLLIAQGANDPRVKRSESEQIVEALRRKGKDVRYLVFEDEGHGFSRPENRLAFYAEAERFLAAHLGGRAEPPTAAEDAVLRRVSTDAPSRSTAS